MFCNFRVQTLMRACKKLRACTQVCTLFRAPLIFGCVGFVSRLGDSVTGGQSSMIPRVYSQSSNRISLELSSLVRLSSSRVDDRMHRASGWSVSSATRSEITLPDLKHSVTYSQERIRLGGVGKEKKDASGLRLLNLCVFH